MGYESNTGLGVYNHYGVRTTGGAVGIETGTDSTLRVTIQFTGESLNSAFLPPLKLPKAQFKTAVLRVDEAFSLTGTTPSVRFGNGDCSTNYIALTEAELENVGTKTPASTGAGTWAYDSSTGTTAAALVTKALAGTNPVVASTQGKATLVLEFFSKAKA